MRVIARRQELCLKVVYYGPGMSGKTTNLLALHRSLPTANRGELIQLDTDAERTLFFDYFPLAAGRVGRFRIKVDFFTVPGQSFYAKTRRAVLDGVDGIVFVADSSPSREQANLVSHADMVSSLIDAGRSLSEVPIVYQFNKRDLPRPVPTKILQSQLCPDDARIIEAVAVRGEGVDETQQAIVDLTLASLRSPARQAS